MRRHPTDRSGGKTGDRTDHSAPRGGLLQGGPQVDGRQLEGQSGAGRARLVLMAEADLGDHEAIRERIGLVTAAGRGRRGLVPAIDLAGHEAIRERIGLVTAAGRGRRGLVRAIDLAGREAIRERIGRVTAARRGPRGLVREIDLGGRVADRSRAGPEVRTKAGVGTNRSVQIVIRAPAKIIGATQKFAMTISVPNNFASDGDVIGDILKNYKTIVVVGLSSNPRRPSFSVTQYMQSAGYRIIPVNPNETEVLGEKCYARLEDIPKSEKLEIVDIFRRSEYVPAIVESAIAVEAKVVWMQQGITNPGAAAKARDAGLIAIEDACILIEHRLRR